MDADGGGEGVRRPACGVRQADEFAAEELAFELHLTPQSAAGQMDYASTVAARLPATFAALAAGRIHPVHVRIIEDETRFLMTRTRPGPMRSCPGWRRG